MSDAELWTPADGRPSTRRAGRLAINILRERGPLDAEAVDRFLARHSSPIIEGERATFLFRGEADEVRVRHRVVGLPDPLPLRRIGDSDLWAATTDLPTGSRVEYQLETRRGEHYERFNDPLNPRLASSPFGASSFSGATAPRLCGATRTCCSTSRRASAAPPATPSSWSTTDWTT